MAMCRARPKTRAARNDSPRSRSPLVNLLLLCVMVPNAPGPGASRVESASTAWPNDYGEGVGVADAWAAFSLSFATFAVACCRRSASFCRFGLGVGVAFTLASSVREQAARPRMQESEIAKRDIFIMMSLGRVVVLHS